MADRLPFPRWYPPRARSRRDVRGGGPAGMFATQESPEVASMVRRLSVIAALAASLSALPAGAAARSPTETPILFVHGWNPFAPLGYSCSAYWADMEHALRTWGWTGPLVTIKYYKHDTQCDVSVADANQETSIESIG